MKTVWLDVKKWKKDLVTLAIENGIDAVLVSKDNVKKVKELGLLSVVSDVSDADLILGKDVLEITIESKKDEERVAGLGNETAIVRSNDWTIIPLENLIAQQKKVIFPVKTLADAEVALTVLEIGVSGVLIESDDIETILEITRYAKKMSLKVPVEELTILDVKKVPMGDRVCIDTITDMKIGEGMLVGNYSSGFFLVHSESIDNQYVAARPFRINAGAVHAYILLPNGKTKYLDELKTGDEVLVVNEKGETFISAIGRIKLEKRPMLNITASAGGKEISVVLQNAETIRLTKPDGKPISVVQLKKGDKVLGYLEEGGRHFGYKIKETIQEK
ncbi:MAG TPA: 3-dehydroquinate synthase II [Spirochaetia bacterium]|nr:MAG: 3-dehydroquinate synthase [Spirochaetes bacterium GWB1_36_13]HCL55990.1 3-dehydroquinate synthase II [Spirochaetia bacterium]